MVPTAIRSRFADAISGSPSYVAADFAGVFQSILARDGVVAGADNSLVVTETSPASMAVKVDLGRAWVQGREFEVFSAFETLTIAASDPTNPRIDRVVVRLNFTAGIAPVTLAVKTGTPAPSPAPPALQRDASFWELSLAQVLVGAGVSQILNANITDERGDVNLCGFVSTWGSVAKVGDTMTGALDIRRALAADLLLHGRVTGDTVQRLEATAAGRIGWGPGNAAIDAFIERIAAAALKLTGSLEATATVKATECQRTSAVTVSGVYVNCVHPLVQGVIPRTAAQFISFPNPFAASPTVTLNTTGVQLVTGSEVAEIIGINRFGFAFGFAHDSTTVRGIEGSISYTATP